MREILKQRTKAFAIKTIILCSKLPKRPEYFIISKQLIRCATSVGANYRASCRARSRADFINKLSIVEEEADESMYWMELLCQLSDEFSDEIHQLTDEANQLVAIFVASKKTARIHSPHS